MTRSLMTRPKEQPLATISEIPLTEVRGTADNLRGLAPARDLGLLQLIVLKAVEL